MNGPALLALQLLDSQLDALEGRRKRLPERAALDGARAAHAAHAAERSRLEAIGSAYARDKNFMRMADQLGEWAIAINKDA